MDELVLVLNANFEPIHVCNTRRAIGLILADKASLVMNGRGVIHTVNHDYPRPSIIRLEKMILRPRPHNQLNRREVFRRDNYTCQYCGKHSTTLTIDHVIPRHQGGSHTWTNVVAACASCNHHKGGKTLDEVGMHLLHIPHEPPTTAMYVFGHHLQQNGEWKEFLTGW
ncbi:HNH endonuclease [Leptolinea tardivitalis]|uniref:HNH endonuclease n=1 Tax=Leptolinea tardivitalis TaxID=229920 RepID=A0A0P6WYQ5_9CHLR|nr:HNH endonuclease [Leptolinea tardivitalis]KPL71711.1 HNH endonuclease [Leptolinea tardivitalis]GAP20064.1 restriction endonuclease [Leptolinea tardivitalis]